MSDRGAYVVEAELVLGAGVEPAAVGAAITADLCGHWEHEGACRWPHNSAIDDACDPVLVRTLFVADRADADLVRERIESVLRGAQAWHVVALRARPPAEAEQTLAASLLGAPA